MSNRSPSLSRYLDAVVASMKRLGVQFQPGLSDIEIMSIENACGFRLPADLAAFLKTSLPVGDGFPLWRGLHATAMDGALSWPLRGLCLDVELNAFWLHTWGPRPTYLAEALAVVREAVSNAPPLVPIYKHRYIPAEPAASGNPVLSVYQTDIVHFGNDLPGYFHLEFGVPIPDWAASEPQPVRFWDEIITINDART